MFVAGRYVPPSTTSPSALRHPLSALDSFMWLIVDLCQWLWEEFQLSVSPQTLSRALRTMGCRRLPARRRHDAHAVGTIVKRPANCPELNAVENVCSSCATTGCPTACSPPTTPSSAIAATPGTNSQTKPWRVMFLRLRDGATEFGESWYYISVPGNWSTSVMLLTFC